MTRNFLDWLELFEAAPPPPPPSGGAAPPPPGSPLGGMGGPPLGGMGMGGGMGGGLGGPPMGGGGMGGGGGSEPVPVKTIDTADVWALLKHIVKNMENYDDLSISHGMQPRKQHQKSDQKISLMS